MSIAKTFAGFVGGIKVAATFARKGKAVVDAFDDDTDGDGFPQFEELKRDFPILLADGKAYALRVKDFAKVAFAFFLHVVEAGGDA